jgi:hypothetical protein
MEGSAKSVSKKTDYEKQKRKMEEDPEYARDVRRWNLIACRKYRAGKKQANSPAIGNSKAIDRH